jgi:hypothetical protein
MSFNTAVTFHTFTTNNKVNDSIAGEAGQFLVLRQCTRICFVCGSFPFVKSDSLVWSTQENQNSNISSDQKSSPSLANRHDEGSANQSRRSAIFCRRSKKQSKKQQKKIPWSYRGQKKAAGPNSSAELSYNLCKSCLINIWGEVGWKNIWNGLTAASPGAARSETWWEDFPSDTMTVNYKVTGKTLRESADNLCCWCTLLVSRLRIRSHDDSGELHGETEEFPMDPGTTPEAIFKVKVEFRGPPSVQPFRFNLLEVEMFGPQKPQMASAFLKFRAFVHTSKC